METEKESSKPLEDLQPQEEPELRVDWKKIVAWYVYF